MDRRRFFQFAAAGVAGFLGMLFSFPVKSIRSSLSDKEALFYQEVD